MSIFKKRISTVKTASTSVELHVQHPTIQDLVDFVAEADAADFPRDQALRIYSTSYPEKYRIYVKREVEE